MAFVTKVMKYLVMLNLCLALASLAGSAWMSRSVGSQAYWAGAVATLVVGLAASLALLLSFLQSLQKRPDNAVSGVLLGMLIRMGLPLGVLVMMQQTQSPLIEFGFMGLLVLNYLVALPLETWMSLQFVQETKTNTSAQPTLDSPQQ